MAKRLEPPKRRSSKAVDVAMVLDRTEDNEGFHIVRRRAANQELEFGTVRPMKEGQPIEGEVVSFRPRKDLPFLLDVKTELPDMRRGTPGKEQRGDGPAQVATPAYRKGWEAAFRTNRPSGAKPN